MKLTLSPAVRAALFSLLLLFLSACSELGQTWQELPGAAFEVRGCSGEGRSLRAGSGAGAGAGGTEPCRVGGELGTLQEQGSGCVTRWPCPALQQSCQTRAVRSCSHQSGIRARIWDLMNDLSPVCLPSC